MKIDHSSYVVEKETYTEHNFWSKNFSVDVNDKFIHIMKWHPADCKPMHFTIGRLDELIGLLSEVRNELKKEGKV